MDKEKENVDSSNITITVIERSANNVCSEALTQTPTRQPDVKILCAQITWAAALALVFEFFHFMYAHLNNNPYLPACGFLLYIVAVNATGCCTRMTQDDDYRAAYDRDDFQSMTAASLGSVSVFISLVAFRLLAGGPDFVHRVPLVVRILYPLPFVLVICGIVAGFVVFREGDSLAS